MQRDEETKEKKEQPTPYKQRKEETQQATSIGSRVICVMGESGSGKTTSMRNLDPATTFYIDADKKGLSWKGWRKQYSVENKNFCCSADVKKITGYLAYISAKAPHIKTVVIDTLNGLMLEDEFARMKEKGYDKWQDLAASVWELVEHAHTLRSDLTVIFVAHSQTERDESGYSFTRLKTSGRKLDKITLESKFTTVLLAKAVNGRYLFETKPNASTAKTPLGAFEETTIDNDITAVLAALEEF